MAEEAKNELALARAEYKEKLGKNPSPRLNAEQIRAKLAELAAAPEAPAEKPKAPKPSKADAEDLKAAGAALVAHPEGVGCSLGGVDLTPDAKGRVLVPLSAVEELKAHGFEPVGEA